MSHAPETSLSSRELAEHIFQSQAPGPEIKWGHCSCCDATLTRVTALIEAWVRVMEAQARFDEMKWWEAHHQHTEQVCRCCQRLATARKQLEETR